MAYVSQEMKKSLAPAIKAVLKEFGMKGSISVNNHSTLCVNIKAGKIDLIDAKENRIKFTHNIYKSNHFKLDHRIEYRHFDTKESHWRYRFILSAKRKIADNVWLWAKIQPRISLKDEKVFDARDQFGVQYRNGKLKVSPFVERGATEDYKHKQIVYGTHVEYEI